MNKTATIIIIIAIVALAAWYFIRKGSSEQKKNDSGLAKPGELEVNEYTTETSVNITPANSSNSAVSAAVIECGLAAQYAHAEWTMKWKGVDISGVTKGASYTWGPIRFQASDGQTYDRLYSATENGARFIIYKWVGSYSSNGQFTDAPGERIQLMIFDTSLSLSAQDMVWPNAIAAKEFDIVTGVLTTLK